MMPALDDTAHAAANISKAITHLVNDVDSAAYWELKQAKAKIEKVMEDLDHEESA